MLEFEMKFWKKLISVAVLVAIAVTVAAPVAAQDQAELERAQREVEMSMRDAERQLDEAAQRIAELSAAELARAGEFETHWVIENSRPVIGITIGSESDSEPVEGVKIIGISPGGAADEAGLHSGDIITAINGESLSSSNSFEANAKLLEFMQGVEEGDVLDLDYLRDNKNASVEVTPSKRDARVFNFNFDGPGSHVPGAPRAPGTMAFAWVSRQGGHGFGEMEMVELNESLGRYFGTDSGLLIIKAPKDNAYKLQDGDVIKNIDGRTPSDLRHAIRILSSYQSGETVNIEILRDKRKQTVTVQVPDNRRSFVVPALPAAPVLAPVPAAAPVPAIMAVPKVRIVRETVERT
jgi:S1-C subfamily serine protease